MRQLANILCFATAVYLMACGRTDFYAQKSKSLDSLSGSISAMIKVLAEADTDLINRAVAKHNYYRQFIHQNVNDTLTKEEGDHLQYFFSAGENLKQFQSNRRLILSRAALVNTQLQKLAEDLRKRSLEPLELQNFMRAESNEARKLTQVGYAQHNLSLSSLETYKHALNEVELIIRTRNSGELPVIIKDTVAL